MCVRTIGIIFLMLTSLFFVSCPNVIDQPDQGESTPEVTALPTQIPTAVPTAVPTEFPTSEPTAIPYPMWNWIYPGGNDWCRDSVMTASGNVLIAGDCTALGGATCYADFWLVQFDINGYVVSEKSYGGLNYEGCGGIAKTSDNGFMVVGTTHTYGKNSGDNSYADAWVLKVDSALNIDWSAAYGKTGKNEIFDNVLVCPDGYLFAGYTEDPVTLKREAWLVKCDSSGSIIWQKSYGLSGQFPWAEARSAIEVSDGYIIAAREFDPYDFGRPWIFKVNKSSGAVIWQKDYHCYCCSEMGMANDIISADGGTNAVIAASDGFDLWVIKIKSSDGTLAWSGMKEFSLGGTIGHSITASDDGGYVVAGERSSIGTLHSEAGVSFKISSSGSTLWGHTYGSVQGQGLYSIVNTGSGGYVHADTRKIRVTFSRNTG
jgi:hypothetical protein